MISKVPVLKSASLKNYSTQLDFDFEKSSYRIVFQHFFQNKVLVDSEGQFGSPRFQPYYISAVSLNRFLTFVWLYRTQFLSANRLIWVLLM